jgi:amino acid transporter
MSAQTDSTTHSQDDGRLKRTLGGRLLFFYVLGDVLGSGIYVLIGDVSGAVGGAFWVAFAIGVSVATVTGMAYAELATKYPQAAGAALYVNRAFDNTALTFLVTVTFLASSFAAAGALATGFASYFAQAWPDGVASPPALAVTIGFVLLLCLVNYIGITESAVATMIMTFVELAGLLIIVVIGGVFVARGDADLSRLTEFDAGDKGPILAIVSGVALAFFAMTGFENAANVAEETVDPQRTFPRALIGGMAAAGLIYVLVSMAAGLVVPVDKLSGSDAALLEVVKAGVLPVSVLLFAVIAMVAITNTTLVAVVTQARILYGMAREDVVPGVFGKLHAKRRSPWMGLIFSAAVVSGLLVVGHLLNSAGFDVDVIARLATVTVALLLFIYAMVIIATFKLRGQDETDKTFRAPTWLLVVGLVGNVVLLGYVVYDDPKALIWCGGLIGLGVVLFLLEYFLGNQDRPEGSRRGDPSIR